MDKINVIERKGNSYIDIKKTSCTGSIAMDVKVKKKPFNTNILVLNKRNNKNNPNNQNNKIVGKITQQLLDCGYSMESIKYCYEKYKFDTIDKALNIIMKDIYTEKYNHNFFSINNYQKLYGKIKTDIPQKDFDRICIICKDIEKFHINYNSENDSSDLNENKDNISKFPLLSRNDYTINCFSELNNPTKINDNVKLGNFKPRKSTKSCFPHIQININLINNIVKDFEKKNDLCLICYVNELKEDNSLKMECGHSFCFECYKHYIKDKIENGIINIKCLMAGCIFIIPDKIIKQFTTQELYRKYLKFKKRNLYLENMKKGLIPCIHPDCEEWIRYKEGDDPNVTCNLGHSFCAKCKQKQHRGRRCKIYERNINKDSRIKPCPNCNYLIEKSGDDNKIICPMCNYTFCWLCLNKCSNFHYYIINIRGCPGLRKADPKSSKILNNNFIQCLWFFLSFIFTLVAFCLIIVLYIFFGAAYELIKFYNNKKYQYSDYDSDIDLSDYVGNGQAVTNEVNNTRMNNSLNAIVQRNNSMRNNNGKCNRDYFIYILLFILGLILQPFFLVYKFLQTLMECYKKFGCWFFYMGNY